MTSPTLERMIRAGCEAADIHFFCSYPECACKQLPTAIPAALSALDTPDDALIEAVAIRDCCGEHCDAANACAGHDVSADGYAEKYGCLSVERQDRMRAALRAAVDHILGRK